MTVFMKNYSLCFVAVLSLTGCKNSQPSLNDTGITWGGNYPNGLNAECIEETIEEQDCSYGRDFTHNNDSDGHAGFSFTKLDSNGNALSASSEEWSCVKDKVAGLVWEVKSDDGGIHDRDNKYRWGGLTAQGAGYGAYYDDWNSLVEGANEENLCGYSNWRVPTRLELRGITDLSRLDPAIDSDYFS